MSARERAVDQPADEQRAFLQGARVARLATVGHDGAPSVVPICYAAVGGRLYSPLDEKPKSVDVRRLKRVRNILENPRVAVVLDRYSEEWSDLGYLVVRGEAALLEPGGAEFEAAVKALREKYAQYRSMAIHERPMIRVEPIAYGSWGVLAPEERTALDLPALLEGRRTVRKYTAQPVAPEHATAILEAARWAPSPHGRQPWRFAVLTRPEPKRRLADAMAATWREQLELDGQPPEVVATRLRKGRERVETAPLAVVLCLYTEDLDRYPDPGRQAAETTMAVQSLGAAAQNMLLRAYGLGLDGGWMCAPLFCPEVVTAALGLDARLVPHALLTFGYAAADPVRRPRRPLSELVALYD